MDFITMLPFTLEIWKAICIIFAMIIVVLSNVANKYWRLRNKMDGDLDALTEQVKKVNENFTMVEKRKERINDLCEALEARKKDVEEIYNRQELQLEELKKILQTLDRSNIYQELHNGETDVFALLKKIASDYDIKKK